MSLYTAHYSEIGLKGGNRRFFEDKLIANIKNALTGKIKKIEKIEKRIFFEADGNENEIKTALSRIFGIEWYAKVYEVKKDKNEIENFILDYLSKSEFDIKNKKIKVETKRGDKKLLFTSLDLSREIGKKIVMKFGCGVDLSKPDLRIYIEIMQKNRAFVYFEKIRGVGGLPVGTSGNIVALLSGGIDSSVASWTMMRRGAKIIFLHIYHSSNYEEVKKSKIMDLISILAKWQNRTKIYFADYLEFYKKTLAIPPKYELVVFRKFIYLLAQEIAKEEEALAILSGDSLGQVASQTLENIHAINKGIEIPVFRPLIGMNKNEIIEMANRIGTYELSIKPYKDCCSLITVKNPETKANVDFVQAIEEKIGMNKIVKKTLENSHVIEISTTDQ